MLCSNGLPEIYEHYVERARLSEEFDLRESDGEICFIESLEIQVGPFWSWLSVILLLATGSILEF